MILLTDFDTPGDQSLPTKSIKITVCRLNWFLLVDFVGRLGHVRRSQSADNKLKIRYVGSEMVDVADRLWHAFHCVISKEKQMVLTDFDTSGAQCRLTKPIKVRSFQIRSKKCQTTLKRNVLEVGKQHIPKVHRSVAKVVHLVDFGNRFGFPINNNSISSKSICFG